MTRPASSDSFQKSDPSVLDLRPEFLNRTILRLVWPAVTENLLFSAVFFADTLMVAWLRNESALAATALVGVWMLFVNAPFFGLSIGASSLVSRSWGERDFEAARQFAGHALILAFGLALIQFVGTWFPAEAIVRVQGGASEVVALGHKFLRIILFSTLLGLPMIVAAGMLRASGNTRTPMYITLGMNVLNIAVSICLTFGLGPWKPLGFWGVAWGTVTARTVGGIAMIAALTNSSRGIGLRFRDLLTYQSPVMRRVCHQAIPSMLERGLHTLSQVVFMRIVAILGTTVLAAHNLALQVESVAFMPCVGLSFAAAAVTGQAIGAGRSDLAEMAVRRTLFWSVSTMVALGSLFVALGPWGIHLFRATPEVLRLAGMAMQLSALEMPFLAAAFVLVGALRGAGDARSPLYVTLFCLVVFRIGVVYLFAITFKWGLAGVWVATAIDWAARTVGLWGFFRAGKWKTLHAREKRRFEEMGKAALEEQEPVL
ncbi:MAG TPA: MATE family efflux transporter [Candidatus Sumerlaeota bacterium]|nr:MATE family efflux transporter [Candidatus Sumerlaeota bacterium]